MEKPLRSHTIVTVSVFFIAITLSAFAVAEAREDRSGQPFQRLQQQIDVLNKCMQPVLTRNQTDLLREASDLGPGRPSVGELLGTGRLSPEVQEEFLHRYLANEGSPEDFWNGLGEDPSFTEDILYELRLTLFLGQLTQYRVPLLIQIKGLRQADDLTTLRDISLLTREQWSQLLAESDADLDPELFIRRVDRAFDALLFGGCN